ncbi:hypothetical protein, partial [Acidovorax sp.]|uniref:hypothetical protein n=1 Tax=Acidovorax sp. TaxID=1872122 RepID=UPI0025BBEECC
YRYFFLGSIVALFVFSLFLIMNGNIKFLAFPEIEGDVIQARVQLPQGIPFQKTERIANLISNALWEVDRNLEKKYQQKIIQQVTIQYGENLDVDSKGNHLVTVSADLLKSEKRKANLSEIFMAWRKLVGVIPDAVAINFKEPQIGPGGRAIDMQVLGDDLNRIKQVAMRLHWCSYRWWVASQVRSLRFCWALLPPRSRAPRLP